MTSYLSSQQRDIHELLLSMQQQLTKAEDTFDKITASFIKERNELEEKINEIIKENEDLKKQLQLNKYNDKMLQLVTERTQLKYRCELLEKELMAVKQNEKKEDQLDVICAKYLEEKERRLNAEEFINRNNK